MEVMASSRCLIEVFLDLFPLTPCVFKGRVSLIRYFRGGLSFTINGLQVCIKMAKSEFRLSNFRVGSFKFKAMLVPILHLLVTRYGVELTDILSLAPRLEPRPSDLLSS